MEISVFPSESVSSASNTLRRWKFVSPCPQMQWEDRNMNGLHHFSDNYSIKVVICNQETGALRRNNMRNCVNKELQTFHGIVAIEG